MAEILSVRDRMWRAYCVRVISFRGQPMSPEYSVITVRNLLALGDAAARRRFGVVAADLEGYRLADWLAIRSDGSIAWDSTTKKELLVIILNGGPRPV